MGAVYSIMYLCRECTVQSVPGMSEYLKKGPNKYLNIFEKLKPPPKICEYIRKIENFTNKYSNIFKAKVWTNIWIYWRPEVIFFWKYALKSWHVRKKWNKTENKYLWIYFDLEANIQIYSNINNVIIWIWILIQDPKYSNILIFALIPGISPIRIRAGMFCGCYKSSAGVSHECYMCFTRLLQECYRSVREV